MGLPRFLSAGFEGFRILDFKEFLRDGRIEIWLEKVPDQAKWQCHRCGEKLRAKRGKYRMCIEGLPIMGNRVFVHFTREKGECRNCRKARAEAIDFIADETPHLTQDYAWWLGKMCEFAPTSRVAEFVDQHETGIWRLDFARMKRMVALYKIPVVKRISVDEVYARKKKNGPDENQNERFFTVVTDLDTRKVIWVSESRSEKALAQFFILIGQAACRKIQVVATDQHDDYARAVRRYCSNATLVWDRFHIMQNFEKVLNETRMELHNELRRGSNMSELTRGRHRFLFLKKANRRTEEEKKHIDQVVKENDKFLKLELIKERMITFFDQPDILQARYAFHDVGKWIIEENFTPLKNWWFNLNYEWNQLANTFKHRVTTSVSEGINNVIKMLKRRAFGYRNMEYFRLKIMQVCGYLNSQFIPSLNQLLTQK